MIFVVKMLKTNNKLKIMYEISFHINLSKYCLSLWIYTLNISSCLICDTKLISFHTVARKGKIFLGPQLLRGAKHWLAFFSVLNVLFKIFLDFLEYCLFYDKWVLRKVWQSQWAHAEPTTSTKTFWFILHEYWYICNLKKGRKI